MGTVEIVGIKKIEFTDKQTGNLVKGVRVFYTWEDTTVSGIACESAFVRTLDEERFKLGAHGILLRNKYGKVEGIHIVD